MQEIAQCSISTYVAKRWWPESCSRLFVNNINSVERGESTIVSNAAIAHRLNKQGLDKVMQLDWTD